ncbi:hypothetical protein PUN28_004283 [Cardiocondyla obscurior]|uniref:Uncharacterized protein n=1 Tax=Cardiocondyla obscurior TaxID=286306 RepID=A0AAW2G9Y8_9HYME
MQHLRVRNLTPSPTYLNGTYETIYQPTQLTPMKTATKTAQTQTFTNRMSYPMNLTRQQPIENLRPVPTGSPSHLNLVNSTPSRLIKNTITYTAPDITQTASRCESLFPVSQPNDKSLIYSSFNIDSHLFPPNSQPSSKPENYHPFADLDLPTSISCQPTTVPHPEENPSTFVSNNNLPNSRF